MELFVLRFGIFRLIYIEPSPADRYWLELMLRNLGLQYSFHGFASCIDAVEQLSSVPVGRVDAVIVNEVLPILDLAHVIQRLRALPEFAHAKCGVTVLEASDPTRIPAGCVALTKPVTPEALLRFLLGV